MVIATVLALISVSSAAPPSSPRIINIYNFIRNSDFRIDNSEEILFDCTRRQIELLKSAGLPATWALQYDALMNPRYQKLLKEQLRPNDEIAAWWEIPRQLAEKAGLKWRGRHDWDPAANVGFSPGYAPDERRKLVDVYMADFKSIFGFYPRSVGSWFIDEVTLDYIVKRYGIVASCNCKDQIGTDFYTLWGGYWNQAYYPSRVNSYMPAQTREGQIDVPVFRMLGSDPIYQHGTTPGLQSLEPVYREAGGSPKWVAWFMNNMIYQPSLAFAYAQAGQENSFGWNAMRDGLTNQVALFAAESRSGNIRMETLAQSGEWFKKHYRLTPATAVVALDDWKEQGRKTVWYDSRFYRVNVLWDKDVFFIRDLHRFDERVVSPTHEMPLMATSLAYETLPIVDWAEWSAAGCAGAGMWPVMLSPDGSSAPLHPYGAPIVKQMDSTKLSIRQPLRGGGTFTLVCGERRLKCSASDASGKPLPWAWKIVGGARLDSSVGRVAASSIDYQHSGFGYRLATVRNAGSFRRTGSGILQITPNAKGEVDLKLDAP